jgi:hypothetical protein
MKRVLVGLQGILVGVRLLPSLHEYPGCMPDTLLGEKGTKSLVGLR